MNLSEIGYSISFFLAVFAAGLIAEAVLLRLGVPKDLASVVAVVSGFATVLGLCWLLGKRYRGRR